MPDAARHPEMPVLVHGDEHADRHQEREHRSHRQVPALATRTSIDSRQRPRRRIGRQDVSKGIHGPRGLSLQDSFDRFGNSQEPQPSRQERRHRDFVGCIERRRRRATGFGRRPGQRQRRKARRRPEPRNPAVPSPRGRGILHRTRFVPASRARGRSGCACPDCRVGPEPTRPRTPPANARCSGDVRPLRPAVVPYRTAGRPR